MAIITVTFRNPITDERLTDCQVDDDMTVRELIERLEEAGFSLPRSWNKPLVFQIKGGSELYGEETLKAGGAKDGDVINMCSPTGGG
jgi:hypothetical protein